MSDLIKVCKIGSTNLGTINCSDCKEYNPHNPEMEALIQERWNLFDDENLSREERDAKSFAILDKLYDANYSNCKINEHRCIRRPEHEGCIVKIKK